MVWKKPTKAIEMSGRGRRPDRLTEKVLSEVKNVRYQHYSTQLRDYVTYAKNSGRSVDLFVRKSTELSSELKAAIKAGDINLRYIPF